MSDKDSFSKEDNMDEAGSRKPSVDYYYLEAMRYLSCSDHHSDDSDPEHCSCNCRRCRKDDNNNDDGDKDQGSPHESFTSYDDSISGRERSWSHSMADDYESGTISQLPNLEGKTVGGRLKGRRFSDGMLLKPNMKLTNGHSHSHVQWADDCKKELTRCRPRKKYSRNPSIKPPPVKSILKHSSEESLPVYEDSESD